jgi:hypothetical protein
MADEQNPDTAGAQDKLRQFWSRIKPLRRIVVATTLSNKFDPIGSTCTPKKMREHLRSLKMAGRGSVMFLSEKVRQELFHYVRDNPDTTVEQLLIHFNSLRILGKD